MQANQKKIHIFIINISFLTNDNWISSIYHVFFSNGTIGHIQLPIHSWVDFNMATIPRIFSLFIYSPYCTFCFWLIFYAYYRYFIYPFVTFSLAFATLLLRFSGEHPNMAYSMTFHIMQYYKFLDYKLVCLSLVLSFILLSGFLSLSRPRIGQTTFSFQLTKDNFFMAVCPKFWCFGLRMKFYQLSMSDYWRKE